MTTTNVFPANDQRLSVLAREVVMRLWTARVALAARPDALKAVEYQLETVRANLRSVDLRAVDVVWPVMPPEPTEDELIEYERIAQVARQAELNRLAEKSASSGAVKA